MSICGRDFVDFAYKMFASREELTEIEVRTIINRAYYGAHHEAKSVAQIEDHSPDCHNEVIRYYENTPNKRIVANKLDSLFIARKNADYHLNRSVFPPSKNKRSETRVYLNKAKSILEELSSK